MGLFLHLEVVMVIPPFMFWY